MKTNVETPLIEAALITLGPIGTNRRLAYFLNAKADMIEGVEKGHIWNVDFVQGKENISRGMQEALGTLMDTMRQVYWEARDVSASSPKWYEAQDTIEVHNTITEYLQLNHAAGKIKQMRKIVKRSPNCAVGFKPYFDMVEEVVLLHNLVESAKPFIEKGRKPAENPVEADITNTGHCAICGNRQKMTAAQKMVHHGFEISGGSGHYYGFRKGSCFGVGYDPTEISCEANIAYIPALENFLASTLQTIENLKENKFESHDEKRRKQEGFRMVDYIVTHLKGTPEYAQINRNLILRNEGVVRQVEGSIEMQKHLVRVWKPKKFDW